MIHDNDQALERYIACVKDLPTLTREAEHDLAVKVRDRDDAAAAEALVCANLRYVVAIAISYRRYDVRLADLIAEGSVGLLTAVKKFDPDKGTRFVTYAAFWIRAYILNAVIRAWSLVGSGSGPLRSKMFFRLRRERARMASMSSGEDEALDTLATQMNTTRERVQEMLQRLDVRDISLDAPLHEDGKTTGIELLEDDSASQDEAYDARVRASLVDGRVRAAVGTLDPRERFIVEQRMMADDEVSLAELGRRLGVSRERTRQLEARARKKLQRTLADLQPALAS